MHTMDNSLENAMSYAIASQPALMNEDPHLQLFQLLQMYKDLQCVYIYIHYQMLQHDH